MATAELTTKKGKAELAEQISFTADQLTLMKNTVAKGATDDEFLLLLHLAKTYGLDPFAKEIWCIKYVPQGRDPRDYPATIFSSRDGYLKIASRDVQMDGLQSDVVCANDDLEKLTDGTVRHVYGKPRGTISGAYALVFRKDRSRPAYFFAPWAEYGAGNNPTWKKYPSAMIVKVAEAMALKRAFSISGLVTQEELGLDGQPTQEPETSAVLVAPVPAAPAVVTYSLADGIKAVLAVESADALKALWPNSNLKQYVGEAVFDLACAATKVRWSAPEYQSPEQANNEVASRAQRDFAHKLLASHKNDAYRVEALHLLADAGLSWAACTGLVDQAQANLKKPDTLAGGTVPKKVPTITTPDRPAQDAQGQPIVYATPDQKQDIINLLNHPLITRQEKTKMLVNINRIQEAQATQSIAKLRKAIEDREGATVAA